MSAIKDIKGISIVKINYLVTSRGVAYNAPFTMDGDEAGNIENRGDGGMTSIDFSNSDVKMEIHNRMKEYFDENDIEVDMDEVREEIFANCLIDMYEFGKVLTPEEQLELLTGE